MPVQPYDHCSRNPDRGKGASRDVAVQSCRVCPNALRLLTPRKSGAPAFAFSWGGSVAARPVRPEYPDASSGCIEGAAQLGLRAGSTPVLAGRLHATRVSGWRKALARHQACPMSPLSPTWERARVRGIIRSATHGDSLRRTITLTSVLSRQGRGGNAGAGCVARPSIRADGESALLGVSGWRKALARHQARPMSPLSPTWERARVRGIIRSATHGDSLRRTITLTSVLSRQGRGGNAGAGCVARAPRVAPMEHRRYSARQGSSFTQDRTATAR